MSEEERAAKAETDEMMRRLHDEKYKDPLAFPPPRAAEPQTETAADADTDPDLARAHITALREYLGTL